MASKFYVIETEYAGPQNDHDSADRHWFDISTEPVCVNRRGDIILQGWCGVNRDYSVYAHGEFDTLEQARHFVEEKLEGKFREEDEDEIRDHEGISARYKVGKYVPYNAQDTYSWAHETLSDISSNMTDDQIRALVDEMESAANSEIGATLNRKTLEEMFSRRRDELRYLEEDNSMGLG